MRTFSELQQEIRPICQRVEQFRLEQYAAYKKALSYLFIPLAVIGIFVVWMLMDTSHIALPISIIGISLAVVACFVIYFSTAKKYKNAYRIEFKSKVMNFFVEMLYPSIRFSADRSIEQRAFFDSELFSRPDRFNGEDYFSGTLGNLKIEFSEVHAQDVRRSTDSKGKTTTSTSTVFRGLFFVLESPNRVYGNVIVVPDTAESTFGGVGKWIQKNLGSYFQGKKMIYFEEHPEFEKQFVVYSSEEEEARRILTPALLQTICEVRNNWKNKIYLAFRESKIYIALPIQKNLFESGLGQSLLDNKVIQALYNEMALCFSAIEEFAE